MLLLHPLGHFWLLFTILHSCNTQHNQVICKSVDARNNVTALEKLRGCTVVEGFVKVVLMENPFVEEDFEPYSFPELREVTQYMLFYRVQGLRSLGQLFPNLEKIGGDGLLTDCALAALVIFEMYQLQEIGLTSLKEISRGSVIIIKNSRLCFVDTVQWDNITKWSAARNFASRNGDSTRCPCCPGHCRECACWNATYCQFGPEVSSWEEQNDCHHLCVGGCHMPGPQGCYTCKGYFDPDGNCVEKCPPETYEYHNRRCVTREECTSSKIIDEENLTDEEDNSTVTNDSSDHYVIYGNQCLESCPSGYEADPGGKECRPCKEGRCLKLCEGAVINNSEEAQQLRGCTQINGSIKITINENMTGAVISLLEENLGSIEKIKGYLQVTHSSIVDLNFLKNLTVILGNDNNKKDLALGIYDNKNLRELWNWDIKKNFTVSNGRLDFHNNPKLCLYHIRRLREVVGFTDKNISNLEIDTRSNGDKCTCVRVDMTVKQISSDYIEVYVPYMENITVLRYVVYYTEDPFKNITMLDDVNECSGYGWRTNEISVVDSYHKYEGFRVNLTDLEPYTPYVFYVTAYTIESVSARSEVLREYTLPTKPSELTILRAFSISSYEIELQWDPPKHINGILQGYEVTWLELNENRSFIDQRDYCKHPMVQDRDEDEFENILPCIKAYNESFCLNSQNLPIDSIEMLCKHFGSIRFPIGSSDKTKYSSCESYFYSSIYHHPYRSGSHLSIQDNHVTGQSSTGYKSKQNKYGSRNQNDIPDYLVSKNKIKHQDGKRILHARSTSVVLNDLKNFNNYVIYIKACRKKYEDETNQSWNNLCSQSQIVTVRTKGNNKSDTIPQHTIQYHVTGKNVRIEWTSPKNPNGLVVAYEIEYRYWESGNPKQIPTECLTHSKYENNSNQHYIENLTSGKYEFRIRAISLFGKGPFTNYFAFEIKHKNNISFLEIFCAVLGVSVILFLIYLSSYFTEPSKYSIVIADVNPNYHYVPDNYEIEREDVEFGRELGTGSFGKVYEGRWKSKNMKCAIKTVNDSATLGNENEFLIEASVMKSMTNAYFIVELFGVVSRGRPLMVLMELMELGDLKSYLRNLRDINPITNATMIKMAYEIADGMAFMEAMKFVHRDLAARNCMVNAELTIKIGDFGMARDIYESDYYIKKNTGFLPIRWMAPESLKDGEYTSQSDIWSYGVVLWEIVTMAEQPYQGSSNDQVLHDVLSGRRLVVPKNSPLPLKTLMMLCWRARPANRSTFINIVGSMEYYHDEEFRRVAYYHSSEVKDIRRNMWEYVEMQPLQEPPSTSYKLATVDEDKTD